jgi:hypothetical protein
VAFACTPSLHPVCAYLCACVIVFVCMRTCICLCAFVCVCVLLFLCVCVCAYLHLCVLLFVCKYLRACVCNSIVVKIGLLPFHFLSHSFYSACKKKYTTLTDHHKLGFHVQ